MNRHPVVVPSRLIRRAILGQAAITGAARVHDPPSFCRGPGGHPASAADPLTVQQVSPAQAGTAIDAALADGEVRGLRLVVAITDAGANLGALACMAGAWLASLNVAIKKACASGHLQAPTAALGRWCSLVDRSTKSRLPTRGWSPSAEGSHWLALAVR